MFKKCLLISLFLLISPVALALRIPYIGAGPTVQNTGGGYTGLLATAFAGYGLSFGQNQGLYLAGELFGDTGSFPLSQNYYLRTNYGFGASIIPGIILNQKSILFMRVGVETFRYSRTLHMFTGGQLGAGLQSNLTGNWDLRGEYVYTGKGIFEGFGTSRFNLFRLGLVYLIK